MYPLSSDAKNATTSATSMGMVGEGQSHFLRSRLAIPSTLSTPTKKNPESTQVINPCATFSRLTNLFKALFKPPQTLLPIHAHPRGPPCVPTESLQLPVRKHSRG